MGVPETEKKTEPFTTWVSKDTAERLAEASQRLGWSPSQLVREAVRRYLPLAEQRADLLEQGCDS